MADWSPLLLEAQLIKLAEQMTVELIMTPRVEFVSVDADECVGVARQRMRGYYDQLPVTGGDAIVGIVHRASLGDVPDSDRVAKHSIGVKNVAILRADDTIHTAVGRLAKTHIAFVFDPRGGDFCGLLHFADLNKQAVRVFLYLWLSALEMGMAEYIRRNHPKLKDWLDLVPSANRAGFLGDFILKRRQRIEIHPVSGLYFSDMLVLMRKLPGVCEQFGIPKKELDQLMKPDPLGDLRNDAMHPVRAIVQKHPDDVVELCDRLTTLQRLNSATLRALSAGS